MAFSGNLTAAVATQVSLYGQVPQGSYEAGSFSDSVTVTLSY